MPVNLPRILKRGSTALWWGIEVVVLGLSVLAFGAASLTREGNVEGLYPWQIDKLRYLLTVSGTWLVFVGLILPVGCLLLDRAKSAEDSSASDRGRPRWASVVLLLCVVGSVVAYGWLANERHSRFNSTGFDLGIKEQVIWNTVHGRLFSR